MLDLEIQFNKKEIYANNKNRNKRIRALYKNKDEHSYTRVTFRELHSEENL